MLAVQPRSSQTPAQVGNEGAQFLAAFQHAPLLRSLDLQLGYNMIQCEGAEGIAALQGSPSIEMLSLNLAVWLVRFPFYPSPIPIPSLPLPFFKHMSSLPP